MDSGNSPTGSRSRRRVRVQHRTGDTGPRSGGRRRFKTSQCAHRLGGEAAKFNTSLCAHRFRIAGDRAQNQPICPPARTRCVMWKREPVKRIMLYESLLRSVPLGGRAEVIAIGQLMQIVRNRRVDCESLGPSDAHQRGGVVGGVSWWSEFLVYSSRGSDIIGEFRHPNSPVAAID